MIIWKKCSELEMKKASEEISGIFATTEVLSFWKQESPSSYQAPSQQWDYLHMRPQVSSQNMTDFHINDIPMSQWILCRNSRQSDEKQIIWNITNQENQRLACYLQFVYINLEEKV